MSGIKHDIGKARWDLIPWDGLEEIVNVMTFGAEKYGDRNWENGLAYSRVWAAAIRHMWKWFHGENNDPETGLSHLAHTGCCILFLLAYERRGNEGDDRPKPQLSARELEKLFEKGFESITG